MCESITSNVVRFSPGEYLFKQGDATKDIYILNSGEVRIYKSEGSSKIELAKAAAGMIVGEIASIDGGVRSASGVAVTPVEAYCINGQDFVSLTNNIPEWLKKIAAILAKRLREIDEKISSIAEIDKCAQAGALLSLISYNCDICKPCGQGFEISLKFLENEMMDILNLQYSETYEILQQLRAKKVLKIERTRVIINDKEMLKGFAEKVFGTSFPTPVT